MKIQIKNRFTLAIIFECEADSLKLGVELAVKAGANLHQADLRGADLHEADLHGANLYEADLHEANLRGADLRGADLYEANLHQADLHGADLHGADLHGANLYEANLYGEKLTKTPIQILGLKWWVCITEKHIQIGCEIHDAAEWFSFKPAEITTMHSDALEWWKIHKLLIKTMWQIHVDSLKKEGI